MRPAPRPASPRPSASASACVASVVVAVAIAVAVAVAPRIAAANPAVEGTRNFTLGDASRASASGSSAYLTNPSAMGADPVLIIDTNYQATIERNSHGLAVVAVDSLNSSRVALGLGYSTMIGAPKISFEDPSMVDAPRSLTLRDRAQEVGLALSINVVKGWFAIAVKPKYQSTSLRFQDPDGERRDASKTIYRFGLDVAATLSILERVNFAVVGYNVAGPMAPVFDSGRELNLAPFSVTPGTINHRYLPRISDYPRGLGHGVAVTPIRDVGLILNADGYYDFTSYHDQRYTRMRFAGSGEYFIGKVALRVGGGWDSRGRGKEDDRGYIAGGLGFVLKAEPGGIGTDLGLGFHRDVTGPLRETFVGANVSITINPNPVGR